MSKTIQKFMYIVFAAIAMAALLMPATRLASRTAAPDDTQAQAVQNLARGALDRPGNGSFISPDSYTWAG